MSDLQSNDGEALAPPSEPINEPHIIDPLALDPETGLQLGVEPTYIPETRILAAKDEIIAFWKEARDTSFGRGVRVAVEFMFPKDPDKIEAIEEARLQTGRGFTF